MFKATHWRLIAASIIFVVIALLLWAQAAERNTLYILEQAGFSHPFSYNSHKSFGAIHLKDISLDADKASTIKDLKASYSFQNNATFLIEGLDLTGDTLEKTIAISGLSKETISPFIWPTLPIDKVILKDARLALLTERWGGINLNYEAHITRNNKNTLEFQMRFTSKQNNLTFGGQATGTITSEKITAKGELEYFKLSTHNTKLTRSNGSFALSWDKEHMPNLTIKTQSGGTQIIGMPWKNIQTELSLQYGEYKAQATATAQGKDHIELMINSFPNEGGNHLTIILFTQKPQALKKFLLQHNQQDLLPLVNTINDDEKNIALILKQRANKTSVATIETDGKKSAIEKTTNLRLNFF